MTYSVRTMDEDGRAFHWWARFISYGDIPGKSLIGYNLQESLDFYDSRAIINPSSYRVGEILEFEDEKYATLFILKWS